MVKQSLKTQHDEFINLVENVLWEASADLEGLFFANGELPAHLNKEVHQAAGSAAVTTSMALLSIVSREYKRIHGLPGADKKCCASCEQRIERWQKLNWGTGEFLYDKRLPNDQIRKPS